MKAKIIRVIGEHGIIVAFLLICIVMTCMTDKFFTNSNIVNILRQISFNGIIAVGMTFVMITGAIDLSVGPTAALAGVIAAQLSLHLGSMPLIVSYLAGLSVAVLCGLINGLVITKIRLTPFIATMATMEIIRGLCLVLTSGRPVIQLPEGFSLLGAGYVYGIPSPVIALVIVVLLSCVILHYSKYGRHVYATGGNEKAAQYSGIRVNYIKISAYCLSGFCAGLAGVMMASRVGAASPVQFEGAELDAIAAAAIGGTSMSGGVGAIWGTVVGALLLGIISNGMDLINISSYYQQIIKGIIILIAIIFDSRALKKRD